MRWAIDIYNNLIKVPIKNLCNGYYLRWYYNGWHYWYFSPGQHNVLTEGEKYRTIGTRRITMGSRQVTRGQAIGIRTIMYTREVYLLTIYGWKNIRIEPGSLVIYNSDITGADMEFTAIIGSKEISYDTGFTPVPAPIPVFCDWFLPSENELLEMYNNLKVSGIGGLGNDSYWSSSETDATHSVSIHFGTGTINGNALKSNANYVRACRSFLSSVIYSLGDSGPVGGWIFHIIDNGDGTYTYYEAAPVDQSLSQIWSNITNGLIGTTGTLIGDGKQNTLDIITQVGHIISAAKLCDDLCNYNFNSYFYCEIVIGTQIWMCKNYDSKYPGSKVYNDDEANRAIYGGLYTFNQVRTAGFCPAGWHVPTLAEWQVLINYLGGDVNLVGGFLKEIGTTHWNAPNTGADNSSGFTALGGGMYSTMYIFLKEYANFWTQDKALGGGFSIQLTNTDASITTLALAINNYLSVRLIKDFPTVIHIYDDWFLPSKNELNEMYLELAVHAVGGFTINNYWSSSESSPTFAWAQNFGTGVQGVGGKGTNEFVRACRSFNSGISYSLRDIGPAGGLIFWKSGNNYLEAAPSDQSVAYTWSNITNVLIGTTDTIIGSGQSNTNEIIAQAGHTDSSAKLCDDFVI
jgi:uncharacterized protein (TIGR02145 family)